MNKNLHRYMWMFWYQTKLESLLFQMDVLVPAKSLWINFGHFICNYVLKFVAKMYNLPNSIKPSSRRKYGELIHSFERWGSKVLFRNQTFTCEYVNFCSITITINPILCKNYSFTKVLRIYAQVILVTGCNLFVIAK